MTAGRTFFCEIRWPVRWVPTVRGKRFFSQNTGGPSGGSPLSGGGIIIFHVIRRHFLAAAMDPAVSLLIRLQRIYNFLLIHAMLSTVLGNIGLYFPLLYYFWD